MSTNFSTIFDGNAGSAQGKAGTTTSTFVISLGSGFVLFGVQFTAFLIFRNYLWAKRIYQPRSFLIPLKDRVKPPPNNFFKWLWTVYKTQEETEVLKKAGMDAYFFLRFLSMCLKIFSAMLVFILPILLPLNYNGGKGTRTIDNHTWNVTGLDTVAWSNVSPEHTDRYWAHLVLAVAVVIWVCYTFHQELLHYIVRRQEFLGSPSHRLKASSTTVLITDIPSEICTPEALTELYDDFPGGIRRVWINRDFSKLVAKDKTRKRFEDLLENAETNLIRRAIRRGVKQRKLDEKSAVEQHDSTTDEQDPAIIPADGGPAASRLELSFEQSGTDEAATPAACRRDLERDLASKAAWTEFLAPKDRPKMRISRPQHQVMFKIPLLGLFFSDSVDTIYYCRRELARLNREIESDIDMPEAYPKNGSAFIQFNTQTAAHLACQAVADVMPRRMTKRTVEISPADINWASLNHKWYSQYFRIPLFIFLFLLLILAFGVISLGTGVLSKASDAADRYSWLAFVRKLPKWLLSFVQGALPPIILVILLSGPLPILLRSMTNKTRGATTGSQGERSLQLWYFIFLMVEVFLIPTISTGLTKTLTQAFASGGTNIPSTLATNLPTAANYFFSFLIVQALSISASSILQTIRLFNFYVLGGVNTPDSIFSKLSWTNRTRIGSNIPWYTTFAVIGLVYSVIAPLILIFMIITFGLFWIVIKNNILYVVRTGDVDGGALFFPSAINQLFTGLYFMEICLIGLFFLVRDVENRVSCKYQGSIMVIVLVLTASYQIWLGSSFSSLYQYAPVRLGAQAARRDAERHEERLLLRQSTANAAGGEEDSNSDSSNDASLAAGNDGVSDLEPVQSLHLRARNNTAASRSQARSEDMQARQRKEAKSAKHVLARLNRPMDEARLAFLESQLLQAEIGVGNTLIPRQKDVEARMMNDPISKIIMQHNDELENLTGEERDMLLSIAFTHPVLRENRPAVWIPRDEFGISDDEVRRTVAMSKHVTIANRGAYFDKKLKVKIDKPPPDMSEFALVMAEL